MAIIRTITAGMAETYGIAQGDSRALAESYMQSIIQAWPFNCMYVRTQIG